MTKNQGVDKFLSRLSRGCNSGAEPVEIVNTMDKMDKNQTYFDSFIL